MWGNTVSAASAAIRAVTLDKSSPDALAALEEERDFLLRSLRDLEDERDAGDIEASARAWVQWGHDKGLAAT